MGVLQLGRRDLVQGRLLRTWLDSQVLPSFTGRVLAVDSAVALRCAALHVPDPRPGRDAMIAAMARVHGMVVITRNVADFRPTGVQTFNPWADQVSLAPIGPA